MIALGSLESIGNRFDDLYFQWKSRFPGNPPKSVKIHDFGYPGWFGRVTSPRCVDLEKSKNMMRVGAIGATESRNKLGMLVVMSLQLSVAIKSERTPWIWELQPRENHVAAFGNVTVKNVCSWMWLMHRRKPERFLGPETKLRAFSGNFLIWKIVIGFSMKISKIENFENFPKNRKFGIFSENRKIWKFCRNSKFFDFFNFRNS